MRRGQRREDGRDRAAVALERLEVGREAVERLRRSRPGVSPRSGVPFGRTEPSTSSRSRTSISSSMRRVGQDLLAQRVGRALDGAPGRVGDDAPATDRRARRGRGVGGRRPRRRRRRGPGPRRRSSRSRSSCPEMSTTPVTTVTRPSGLEAADGRGRLAAARPRPDGEPDPLAVGQRRPVAVERMVGEPGEAFVEADARPTASRRPSRRRGRRRCAAGARSGRSRGGPPARRAAARGRTSPAAHRAHGTRRCRPGWSRRRRPRSRARAQRYGPTVRIAAIPSMLFSAKPPVSKQEPRPQAGEAAVARGTERRPRGSRPGPGWSSGSPRAGSARRGPAGAG